MVRLRGRSGAVDGDVMVITSRQIARNGSQTLPRVNDARPNDKIKQVTTPPTALTTSYQSANMNCKIVKIITTCFGFLAETVVAKHSSSHSALINTVIA